jgi:hypothetical protein
LVAESKFVDKPGESKRGETLKLSMIDHEYLERLIEDDLENFRDTHTDYFRERQEWLAGIRDLKYQYKSGYFDEASDLHVPYTLTMAKAMHARIFQIFSARNLFSVEANNVGFQDREETIKYFMNWALEKWVNRGMGKKATVDAWITDIVEDGTGILKLMWDEWEDTFIDLEIDIEEEQQEPSIFAGLEGMESEEENPEVKAKIRNKKKTLTQSAPKMGTVSADDFYMPPGQDDVQSSPWVAHKVILRDDDLKLRVKQGRFDKDVVEEALERRAMALRDNDDDRRNLKRQHRRLEGVEDEDIRKGKLVIEDHTIFEWYGRAYVNKNVDDDTFTDMDELPQEVVIWYHGELRKILGWTYLHRISPSGKRPFYKADFMPSKERAFGIGIGELLFSLNNHIDAVHNIKLDNGILASMQFGTYRAGSSFKPDTFKVRPGDLIPVEDVNDVKFQNVPYLGSFGENEEATLTGYGSKMLAINDINLGNVGGAGVAGALRNATGANFIDRQANIQLNPHIDRIARTLNHFFSDFFILTRSRMKEELYFRVTGEDGRPVFKDVKREDLRGDFDFLIDTDVAATSEQEKQQRASLMLQTLLNPTLMQMGILQPGNLYEAMKEFLLRHQVRNPDAYITKPADYMGPPLSPETRVFKILMNQTNNPPIEDTVKPEEDHESALEFYQEFEESDQFGLFGPEQVEAWAALKEAHTRMLSMTQNVAGMPNIAGTQFSNEGGLPTLGPQGQNGVPDAGASEGGPLGSPVGEPNGPVQ